MPSPDVPTVAERDARLDAELAGLDALELAGGQRRPLASRIWSIAWPKLAAIAIGLIAWQAVVSSEWKPEVVLPGPRKVWDALLDEAASGNLWPAVGTTLQRAAWGFALAMVIGVLLGAAVSQSTILRRAIGSFISGLQTMPSIAWFPMAIVLFGSTSTSAMYFVIVLGAAPSIANGLLSGIDNLPPLLHRVGRTMGAKGWSMFRYVILPGSLPSFVGGIKQGWAFAWRSLMAGELLVIIANKRSIGERLDHTRQLSQIPAMYGYMVVILVIGLVLDALVFGAAERAVQRRWGLTGGKDT
jgi:NitT/TauT family transport system permease protein